MASSFANLGKRAEQTLALIYPGGRHVLALPNSSESTSLGYVTTHADLVRLELPVTECLDDLVGRTGPERPLLSAPFAQRDASRILLNDN